MCRLISFNKAALAGLTGCCWLWLGEAISLRLLSSACWSTSTSRCAMASSTAMRFWASALSMQSMLYWSLWWAAEVRDSRKATISSATMSRSSSGAAPLIWSRVNDSAWPLSWVLGREVGGGDDRTGVGGVGVRIEVLLGGAGGTCEEGGGVMEDEGGFGDWYLSRSLLAAALWFEAVSCEGWRGLATGCRRSSCDMASSSWATDSRWSMTMRRQTGRDNAACASGELELVGRTREVAGRTRVMIGGAAGEVGRATVAHEALALDRRETQPGTQAATTRQRACNRRNGGLRQRAGGRCSRMGAAMAGSSLMHGV